MKNKKDQAPFVLPPGHAPLVSRRQFVAHGLTAASSWLTMPSILTGLMAPENALAEGCAGSSASNFVQLVIVDLSGGFNMHANVVPLKKLASQPGNPNTFEILQDYSVCGIPAGMETNHNTEFGHPIWNFAAQPGFLQSLLAATSVSGVRGSVQMASLYTITTDDTETNPSNPMVLASSAGLRGNSLTAIGTSNRLSGGNSAPVRQLFQYKPVRVNNQQALFNSLGLGAILGAQTNAAQKTSLINLLSDLAPKAATGRPVRHDDVFRQLLGCAQGEMPKFTTTNPDADARTNAILQNIYGIVAGTNANDGNLTQDAAIAQALLANIAGSATIEIGGCDFHQGASADQVAAKEREVGTRLGRIISAFSRSNRPALIAVISDGSMRSNAFQRNFTGAAGTDNSFTGDSERTSMHLLIAVNPLSRGTRPAMRRMQVGGFEYFAARGTESSRQQVASSYISNDPKKLAYTIFLNWLSVNGLLALAPNYIPTSDFDASQYASSIVFEQMV